MRYINIDQIEPGQILGKSIFTSNGQVLLAEGVFLTVYMINTLRRLGATAIYIKDSNYSDVEIEDVVSEETKQAVVKQMSAAFDAIRSGKDFSSRQISVSIDSLLEEVMRNKDVLLQLSDIRTADNESYVHAINVCIMSILIGLNMDLNPAQLKELAIGALFHDIGKVELAEEGEEDEENQEKKEKQVQDSGKHHHAWRGFEIIKNKREYSLLIAHVALQHHEAIDGSGVPRGLGSDEIHLYAKIVAVANTYDNLVSASEQGKALLPHEAAEKLMAYVGTLLDHDVTVHFLKTVSIYPTGTSVRLSNRETGVVVGQHKGLPSRPIVRVVTTSKNADDIDVKEYDLAKLPTLFIESTLN